MANQFRNYILTVNNPTQTDNEFFDYLKTLPNIKYFTTMKEYFPTAHIESRKGSKTKARDYCQKADTRMDGMITTNTANLPRAANART